MNLEQAKNLKELLAPLVPGLKVKEHIISSLFIGPTEGGAFLEFLNEYLRNGWQAVYQFEFHELSVYGSTSPTSDNGDPRIVPSVNLVILDNMRIELMN